MLSCAGGAEVRLEARQTEKESVPDPRRDEIKIARQVAIARAKAGDATGAMASVQEALNSARDKAALAGALFPADCVASGSVIKADSGWLIAYALSGADDGRIVASDFAVVSDHAAIIAAAGRFAGMLDGLSMPEAR